jgi:hypothetical protein
LLPGCAESTLEGLYPTVREGGARIRFDVEKKPVPDIPFPIDLAARPDTGSPTGRRLNISEEAPTVFERDMRKRLNTLDGFGTFAPATLSFDGPLDIPNVLERHSKSEDPADDVAYLINIDPASAGYSEAVALDIGGGNFPYTLEESDQYYPFDPHAGSCNLLFDTNDEQDADGNGMFDPAEDLDSDGVRDSPNLIPGGTECYRNLMSFYDRETQKLFIRPLMPLRERTRYAVVITKRLLDDRGKSVESPFPYVNHPAQTEELWPLVAVLPRHGLNLPDVAFAWSFTTQSVTSEIAEIRDGLHGGGRLGTALKGFGNSMTVIHRVVDRAAGGSLYRVKGKTVAKFIEELGPFLLDVDQRYIKAWADGYDLVDYIVSGEFETPALIGDDGVFVPDLAAVTKGERVPFWLAVPKAKGSFRPPFPVAIYSHGYSSSRIELLGFAGSLARFGFATAAIESYGAGLEVPREYMNIVKPALEAYNISNMLGALLTGRARDLNADGAVDSCGDFWTADTFHTRDVVRQTVVDHMAFVKMLKNFDGKRTFSGLEPKGDLDGDDKVELAGDFNGDGVVDVGGPDNGYFIMGQSMGGIVSTIIAAVEPSIVAAAPGSGGGGLADIGMRSMIPSVRDAVMLPIMGPFIVGKPDEEGAPALHFYTNDVNTGALVPIGSGLHFQKGDIIWVRNLQNGEVRRGYVGESGGFAVPIPADEGDPIQVSIGDAAGYAFETVSTFGQDVSFSGRRYRAGERLVAINKGLGKDRNSSDFRTLLNFAQVALEPADPLNFAPFFFQRNIPHQSYAGRVAPVLLVATVGDQDVPIHTAVSLARAAGIIGYGGPDPAYRKSQNRMLVENFFLEGLERLNRHGTDVLFDPDNLSDGTDGFAAPRIDPPLRATVRFQGSAFGARFPYIEPHGTHGFYVPSPQKKFDVDTYMINQIGWFFATNGREIVDDLCLAKGDCAFFPK